MCAKQNLEMIGMTPLSSIAMSAYTDLVRLLKDDALSGVEGKPTLKERGDKAYWYAARRVGTEIIGQLEERHVLQQDIKRQRARAQDELMRLRRDMMEYQLYDGPDRGPDSPDPTRQRGRKRQSRRYDR